MVKLPVQQSPAEEPRFIKWILSKLAPYSIFLVIGTAPRHVELQTIHNA